MRKLVVMLVAICSIYCLVGCGGGNTQQEVSGDSQQESTVQGEDGEIASNEANSDMTESTTESTSEAATGETPAEESTSESTTVVYEGIDMESALPGVDWVQTFVGVIEEPKVVVFNDETGRKEIIEEGGVVKFNPDVDLIAVYVPEGTILVTDEYKGIIVKESYSYEYCEVFKLNAEMARKYGRQSAAIYADFNGEEVALTFDFRPE